MSDMDDLENSLFGLSKSSKSPTKKRPSTASSFGEGSSKESSPRRSEAMARKLSVSTSSSPTKPENTIGSSSESGSAKTAIKTLKGKEDADVPSFLLQSSDSSSAAASGRKRRGLESSARKNLVQSINTTNKQSTENLLVSVREEDAATPSSNQSNTNIQSSMESTSIISRPSESLDSLTNKKKPVVNYTLLSDDEKRKLWSRWLNLSTSSDSSQQFYIEIGVLSKIPFPWIEKNGGFVNAKDGVVLREHPCAQKIREQIYENKTFSAPDLFVSSDEEDLRNGSGDEQEQKIEAIKPIASESNSMQPTQSDEKLGHEGHKMASVEASTESFNQKSNSESLNQFDKSEVSMISQSKESVVKAPAIDLQSKDSIQTQSLDQKEKLYHVDHQTPTFRNENSGETTQRPSFRSDIDGSELHRLSESIERSAKNVEMMKTVIEHDHSRIMMERESVLREEEKRIIELRVKLDLDQKELSKERLQLNETLKAVDLSMKQSKTFEDETRRQIYLDRQHMEQQQELLEREKRAFYEKQSMERAELQRQQEALILEQKSLLDQITSERKEILVERGNLKSLEDRRMQKEVELTHRLNTFESHLMKEMNEFEQRKRDFELEVINFKKDQSDLISQKFKYSEMVQTLEKDLALVQKERNAAERELRESRDNLMKAERERRDAERMLHEKQELEDSLKLLERKLNEKERSIKIIQKRHERERLEFVQEVKTTWNQRGMNDFEQELKDIQNRLSVESLKNLSQYVTAPAIMNHQLLNFSCHRPRSDPMRQLHNQMQLKRAINYINNDDFDPSLQEQRRFLHHLQYNGA